MTLSLLIKNARIADGSGAPSYIADVGVSGDRIVNIGRLNDVGAAQYVDGTGMVLAPGFIDIHTHYDPQLCWDPTVAPSPEHGVTSVVIGNCSLSLAPLRVEHRRTLTRLFGTVEDMSDSTFDQAVPFSWETFPQYLEFTRRNLAVNVGALIGHTSLRYYVMGAAAAQRPASDAELSAMAALVEEAMHAGAMGLSLTYSHKDEHGRKLPSQFADFRELQALCAAMMKSARGVLEVAPNMRSTSETLDTLDLLGRVSLETGVIASSDGIVESPVLGNQWEQQLERLELWQQRGARLFAQVQVRPMDQTFKLSGNAMHLSRGPTWIRIFASDKSARARALADPALRSALNDEAQSTISIHEATRVREVSSGANGRYAGRRLSEIAAERSTSLIDAMLDISLADDLETVFGYSGVNHANTDIVSTLLNHPLTQIGAADAGAHIGQFAGAGDTSYLFEHFVRKLKAMPVERAVHRLTGSLARQWGIKDRGDISPGKYADLVLFDPETIARGEEIRVQDVPGGVSRYVRHPVGVHSVFVNGRQLVQGNTYTSERAGHLV
jgi:N-acyl-D-aspartate/D-glutamate deacylase